jgi:protein-S-isoprenylcysteine O-methyltransferase Ste14
VTPENGVPRPLRDFFYSFVRSRKVREVPSVNRFAAHSVIVLASLVGGGSFLVFGVFLIAGPFSIVRFDVSEPQALLWDGFLSMSFFLQHSGMIRPSFRTWLSSTIPPYYHAATYAIASGTVLTGVVLLWQPSHTVLFEVQGPLQLLFRAAFLLAIAGSMWGIWALSGFDPFGRIPITSCLGGKQQQAPHFVVRGPYFWVRHPLYFFMLVLIWATPDVNSDRLLFNVLWTSWLVFGSYLEERDLVAEFGENYRHYQKTVPMILPWRGPVGRGLQSS